MAEIPHRKAVWEAGGGGLASASWVSGYVRGPCRGSGTATCGARRTGVMTLTPAWRVTRSLMQAALRAGTRVLELGVGTALGVTPLVTFGVTSRFLPSDKTDPLAKLPPCL